MQLQANALHFTIAHAYAEPEFAGLLLPHLTLHCRLDAGVQA